MDNLLERLLKRHTASPLIVSLIQLVQSQREHIKKQDKLIKEMGAL